VNVFFVGIVSIDLPLETMKISAEVKVKLKFSLEQAMKAQRGSRVIALLFL
jgi:hypothetical protein